MLAGKSLVFRVTRMRPRTCADARMTESGSFSDRRSLRKAAARAAIDASSSSILHAESRDRVRSSVASLTRDMTSIHVTRLIQDSSTRSSSTNAFSIPLSASIRMLLSKDAALNSGQALASDPRPDNARAHGRPGHRINPEIPLSLLHNPDPMASSNSPARGVATRQRRRYPFGPSTRQTQPLAPLACDPDHRCSRSDTSRLPHGRWPCATFLSLPRADPASECRHQEYRL